MTKQMSRQEILAEIDCLKVEIEMNERTISRNKVEIPKLERETLEAERDNAIMALNIMQLRSKL